MARMSLQFQCPCSVSKLELIFLCQMGRIRRFYGKDVTAASVNLFSVQTGADIPLPPKKEYKDFMEKNLLQFQRPCSVSNLELIFLCRLKGIERFYGKDFTAIFSDPVHCSTWS